MGQLEKFELQLDELLNKKAPFSLPPNGRKALAHALWWIALIVGVLELWSAFALWHLGHAVDHAVDVINSLSTYYGGPAAVTTPHLGLFYYLTLIVMAVVGVVMLLATPQLKNMKKSGWNLLFYAALFEAVVAVLRLFSNVGGGITNFLGAAVGAVVAAYFLFQVRDFFTHASAPVPATAPSATHDEPKAAAQEHAGAAAHDSKTKTEHKRKEHTPKHEEDK
ncbi:MAG TPA: hypothetical protein VJP80_02105 [Candidatus Saccharimonadales bacterium]|nr:hypothetical protein [Candidatus Saccharimonadales bacterium]